MIERRSGERRRGERRSVDRGGPDRRRGERRVLAGVVLTVAAAAPVAADVYTRRNSDGVLEATNIPGRPDFKLTYRSKGAVLHAEGFRSGAALRRRFEAEIDAASALHGVSQDLIRAIIEVESGFDHLAVSTAGAGGLMQLMPETALRFGVRDRFDARQNILGGTRYLRVLLDLYQGNIHLSAAAYNAGEGAVARYNGIPPFRETRNYVRRVAALLGLGGGQGAAPGSRGR